MTTHDFFITPIYLLILTVIALSFRNTIKDRYLSKYYTWALYSKFIGAIALGVIYTYYYGGGDTISYHHLGHQIAVIATFDFDKYFRIVTQSIAEQQADLRVFTGRNIFVQKGDERTYFVVRLVAIIDLLTSRTYTVKALIFSCYSFIGTALMYLSFADIYPRMRKRIFIICFFIPSVVFWGSGLMKDTLTFGSLGVSFYGFYFGIIKRRSPFIHVPLLLFGFWLIYKVKLYILICWLPALALWFYLEYNSAIKSWFLRVIIAPVLFIGAAYGGYIGVTQLTTGTEYSFDRLAEKTAVTSNYLQSISSEGGSYDLGEFDGTLTGLFRYLPQAVAVSLFRPFPWEVGFNPVRLLSAFEAFGFLILTLRIFRDSNPLKVLRIIIAEPPVAAFLAFAIMFAFAVGVASGNFGALVRYKIPLMPFYLIALFVILEKSNQQNKGIKKKKTRQKVRRRKRKTTDTIGHLATPKSGFQHRN